MYVETISNMQTYFKQNFYGFEDII